MRLRRTRAALVTALLVGVGLPATPARAVPDIEALAPVITPLSLATPGGTASSLVRVLNPGATTASGEVVVRLDADTTGGTVSGGPSADVGPRSLPPRRRPAGGPAS